MKREEILASVEKCFSKFNPGDIEITEQSKLNELILDSIDLLDAAMEIERELGINIPDEAIEKWSTFGDIMDTVETIKR